MTGSLKGILSEIFPSEPEDGDKDGNNGDRFTESPAPGMDDQIIQQGAGRAEQLGQPDLLGISGPVADTGDRDRSKGQKTGPSGPRIYGDNRQKSYDPCKCYFAAGPFPFISLQQKDISDNIDDQTQSAGICSHQEELDTEDQTSHQLAQKQGTVGPDLIGDDEKRYADKADRLYE